ncbi:MAG: hypothetical protein FWE31_05135 [Firmicutes bacterium]|nr:hypothetical protein [Bacillota bacterium]
MKRKFALTTGILAIVFSSLLLLAYLIFLIALIIIVADEGGAFGAVWIVLIGILIFISATQITLGATLIKESQRKDLPTSILTNLVVGILVLSLFSGGIILLGFAIATLCIKGDEGTSEILITNTYTTESPGSNFTQALARLKQYHADGIIDKETYEAKANELFKKEYL